MITLTAKMQIQGKNSLPFKLGENRVGDSWLFGETINVIVNFNRRSLLSIETEITDRDNTNSISWGIISTGGHFEFNDTNSRFLGYANAGLLKEGIKVEFFIENTLTKAKETAGVYYTSDWNYDNNTRSVSVSFKDDLEQWQDIQIEGFSYDVRNPAKVLTNKNMADLYEWLYERTPKKYNMLSFSALDSATKNILNITTLPYPLLESGSLWTQWTKLCVVCGLHIYKNSQGITVCSYNYGA